MNWGNLASVGTGLVQGLNQGLTNQYNIETQGRTERRAIQEFDAKMKKYNAESPYYDDTAKLQFDQLKTQVTELQNKLARDDTFKAFDAFDASNDPKYLNIALKNPDIAKAFPNVTSIAKFNPYDKTQLNQLYKFGIPQEAINLDEQGTLTTSTDFNYDALSNEFLVVTSTDGTQTVTPKTGLYGMTGYLNYKSDKEQEDILNKAKAAYYMGTGRGSMGKDTAFSKNYEKLLEIDPTGKLAETYAKSTSGMDTKGTTFSRDVEYLTSTYGPDVAKAFVTSKTLSEGQIKEKDIKTTKDNISKTVGSVTDITRISKLPNDNSQKVALANEMNTLARQQGLNIDQFISTELKGAISASNFGEAAAQISTAEAGPIDNLIKQFRNYIDPNVKPSDPATLYNQVGIQMANTIFGATYTPSENAKFQDGFGSLAQQPGAIRSKAKAVLGSYLDTLNSLSAKISDPQLFAYHIQPRIDAIKEAMAKLDKGTAGVKSTSGGSTLTQKTNKIPIYKTADEIRQANPKAGDRFYFGSTLMEIKLVNGKLVPVKVNK